MLRHTTRKRVRDARSHLPPLVRPNIAVQHPDTVKEGGRGGKRIVKNVIERKTYPNGKIER